MLKQYETLVGAFYGPMVYLNARYCIAAEYADRGFVVTMINGNKYTLSSNGAREFLKDVEAAKADAKASKE